jgi:TatD DNase family protein
VTFKNADMLRDAAVATPLENIVVETDSPFLTPHPHRGKRNEPAYVTFVADAIAGLKGIPIQEAGRALSANASRLFAWNGI